MNCPMPGDEPRRTRMCWNPRYSNPFFAGLVVIAGEFHPIPFRTRPLKPPAPMVLRVNTRESRSPPGLPNTDRKKPPSHNKSPAREIARGFCVSRCSVTFAQLDRRDADEKVLWLCGCGGAVHARRG